MAQPFVLTAEVQFQAPQLTRFAQQVRQQLQQQLNVNVNVNTGNANQQLGNTAKQTANVANQANVAANNMSKFSKQLKGAVFYALRTQIAYAAIRVVTRGISDATSAAFKFERQMIKISQVTGRSVKQLQGLQKAISDISTELGVSSSSLVDVTRILAQTGMSADDTRIAMQALAKTTLAPTFDDIKNTAETAVAAMRQFKIEAGGLERVLGQINSIAGQFAVEASDIGTAIKRAGGAFRAAGGEVEELMALFTAVRSTTRETAETIATGFRTIFTRLQRPTTIKFLRQFGVELQDLNGKFVGPYDAVRRLNAALSELDPKDIRYSLIIEQLGGFRQVSKVIPLIQQFSEAEKARAVALASSNSLDRDAATAQQAAIVRFTKLTEKVKELFRTITASKGFQTFLDILIKITSAAIKLADTLSPLIPLIGFIGLRVAGGFAAKGVGKMLGFNKGGIVPGSGNTDSVPAMLTPGEFVIKKSSVKSIGAQNLFAMNKYAYGGRAADDIPGMSFQKRVVREAKNLAKPSKTPFESNSQFNALDSMYTNSHKTYGVSFEQGSKPGMYTAIARGMSKGAGTLRGKNQFKLTGNPATLDGVAFEKALIKSGLMKEGGGTTGGNQRFDGKRRGAFVEARSRGEKSGESTILGKAYGQALLGGINASKTTGDIDSSIVLDLDSILFENKSKLDAKKAKRKAMAKSVRRKNRGGGISGGDSVPALLTPGEFVVNAKSAKSIGYGNLARMNRHGAARFNKGGIVGLNTGSAGAVGGGGFGGFTNLLFVATMLPALLDALGESASGLADDLAGGDQAIKDMIVAFGTLLTVTGLVIAAKNAEALASTKLVGQKMFGGVSKGLRAGALKNRLTASGRTGLADRIGVGKGSQLASAGLGKIGKGFTTLGSKMGKFGGVFTKIGGQFTAAAGGAVAPLIAIAAAAAAVVAGFYAIYKGFDVMGDRGVKALEEGKGTANFMGFEMDAESAVVASEYGKAIMLAFINPIGLFTAGITAQQRILAAKQKRAFTLMSEQFEKANKMFEEGTITAASYISTTGRTLQAVSRRSGQLTSKEDLQNFEKVREEAIKGAVAGLDKLVKETTGTDANVAIAQFEATAFPTLKKLAEFQGIPVQQLIDKYRDQIKVQAKANERMEAMTETIRAVNRLRQSMGFILGALENYSRSLDRQKTSLDNLSAVADNASMSLAKFEKLDVTQRSIIGNSGGAGAGFAATATLGGGSLGSIGTSGTVVAAIADIVNTDLSTIIGEAQLEQLGTGADIEDIIRRKVEEQLAAQGVDITDQTVVAQLDAFSAKLGAMATDADGAKKSLREFVEADLPGTTKKLIEALPGKIAIDLFNEIRAIVAKQTEQLAKAFQKRTDLEQKYTAALSKVVSIQQDNAKIIRGMTGESIQPGQAQADFERRQNIMLRNTSAAGMGGNLEGVGNAAFQNRARRKQIQEELDALNKKQAEQQGGLSDEDIKKRRALLSESESLRSQFKDLTGVLENYASSTQRLQMLQDQLGKARKEREAKGSLAEDIMFGDASSSNKAIRTALATRRTEETGSLAGLSRERQGDVIGFLRAQGKGKQAEQLMISEFQRRYAGQADPNVLKEQAKALFEASKTEVDIMREIRDVLKEREDAAKILAELQGQALDDMNQAIATMNAKFLSELKQIMLEASQRQLQAEERAAEEAKAAATANLAAAESVRNTMGLTNEQFNKINTEAGRGFLKEFTAQNMTNMETSTIAEILRKEGSDEAGFGGSQGISRYLGISHDAMEDFIRANAPDQILENTSGNFDSDISAMNVAGKSAVKDFVTKRLKAQYGDSPELLAKIQAKFNQMYADLIAQGESFDIDDIGSVVNEAVLAGAKERQEAQDALNERAEDFFGPNAQQIMSNFLANQDSINQQLAKIPIGETMKGFNDAITKTTDRLDSVVGSLNDIQLELNSAKTEAAAAEAAAEANRPRRPSVDSVTSRYAGGMVYASTGAFIRKGTDTIPAMLTPGEFVVRKAAVDAVGVSTLRSINNMGRAGTKRRGGNGYYADGDLASGGGVAMIDASQFDKSIQRFSVQIDRLSDVLRGGFSVDVGGTINVDVHLNGAEWLSEAEGAIGEIAAGKVRQGINSMLKKHFPKLGRDSEVIGKRRSKTIETNVQT